MCMKKSYFSDCWKVLRLSEVAEFKNVEEGSASKSYSTVL